jgi:hypothetical protein
LAFAAPAQAHRLDAQVFVLPDKKIRVESWFSNGDVPHGALVHVYGAQNQLLYEGTLDEKGNWVFSYDRMEPMRIVVSVPGHRKELPLDASGVPQHDIAFPIKDVMVGIGFLLALAAFVLSVRNARRLRALERSAAKEP